MCFRGKSATWLFVGTAPRQQACWESREPAPPLISAQALVETAKGTGHSHAAPSPQLLEQVHVPQSWEEERTWFARGVQAAPLVAALLCPLLKRES